VFITKCVTKGPIKFVYDTLVKPGCNLTLLELCDFSSVRQFSYRHFFQYPHITSHKVSIGDGVDLYSSFVNLLLVNLSETVFKMKNNFHNLIKRNTQYFYHQPCLIKLVP
jgi:hypothetical protein